MSTALLRCIVPAASLLVPAVAHAQPASGASTHPTPLILHAVRCVVGGTVPAYFVDVQVHATRAVTGLTATSFELQTPAGVWVSGTTGPITLRDLRGMTPGGAFDLRPFRGTLPAGGSLTLQVFGQLALLAYGQDAGYPDVPLAFRVRLVDSTGRHWEVAGGPCLVGPAG